MKKSKFFPLVLALVLFLITALPLTAAAVGGTAKIIVEYPAGHDLGGHVFKVYKILDVTTDGSGGYAYELDPRFEGFEDYPTFGLQLFLDYLGKSGLTDNSPAITAIASNLWTYVATTSMVPDKTAVGESWSQTVTFENLEPGYYLVYSESTVPDDVDIVAACSLVTATSVADVKVEPKVDVPTLADLKIWNPAYTGPGFGDWSEDLSGPLTKALLDPPSHHWRNWTDVNIGDTVNFRVRALVPKMTGYESNGYGYDYIVHIDLSEGLTFDPASVVVHVGGVEKGNPVVYQVVPVAGGAKIVFTPGEFVQFTPGDLIEIWYSAMLNEKAVIGGPEGNKSTVQLEYSADPAGPKASHGKSLPMTDKVYTFQLKIFKFYDTNKALAGAEFELKRGSAAIPLVQTHKVPSSGDTSGHNVYRVAMPGETAVTTVETPASGLVTIKGLAAGAYTLVETRAPDGFNKLAIGNAIVITHTDSQGNYEMTVDGGLSDRVNVENHTGPILPATGGVGTTIFYAFSAVLTTLLAAFFVIRRRKNILKG